MRIVAVPACVLAASLIAYAVPAPTERRPAAENLDGVWLCTEIDTGDVVAWPHLVGKLNFRFAGNNLTIDAAPGKRASSFTADFTKNPGWLDIYTESPPDKEKRILALFLRDGDTLKISMANHIGCARPTEFKADGRFLLITLKLQK
jgi:uncharacterized protein (TIGR03067 family)